MEFFIGTLSIFREALKPHDDTTNFKQLPLPSPPSNDEAYKKLSRAIRTIQSVVEIDSHGLLVVNGLHLANYYYLFRSGKFEQVFNALNVSFEVSDEQLLRLKKDLKSIVLDIKVGHNFRKKKDLILTQAPKLSVLDVPLSPGYRPDNMQLECYLQIIDYISSPPSNCDGWFSKLNCAGGFEELIQAAIDREGVFIAGRRETLRSENLPFTSHGNNQLLGVNSSASNTSNELTGQLLPSVRMYLQKRDPSFEPSAPIPPPIFKQALQQMFLGGESSFLKYLDTTVNYNTDDIFSLGFINTAHLHPAYGVYFAQNNALDVLLDIAFKKNITINDFIGSLKVVDNLYPLGDNQPTGVINDSPLQPAAPTAPLPPSTTATVQPSEQPTFVPPPIPPRSRPPLPSAPHKPPNVAQNGKRVVTFGPFKSVPQNDPPPNDEPTEETENNNRTAVWLSLAGVLLVLIIIISIAIVTFRNQSNQSPPLPPLSNSYRRYNAGINYMQ